MSNTSKCQHLKLYFRLQNNECIIEKSVEGFMNYSKSLDPEIWNSLKRDIEKSENERQKLAFSMKETIINTYAELKLVKAIINKANTEKIELDSFKKKLQCLWKKIQEFKILCNNSFDTLVEAQSTLDDDLNTISRVINKHKNYSNNFHYKFFFKTQPEKEEISKECDYDKVEDFCSLLAKTGHTGNWSETDHLLFLRLRKSHKSIASLVRAIQSKCPDLSKECIINHESWYKTYLELRDKQKLAVEEWRKRKQMERLEKAAKEVETQPKPPVDHLLNFPEHKKAEVERKKEMVRQWKEQKEKVRAAEEELMMKRLRVKKENKENRRRLRALRLKKLIIDRKENKFPEGKKCSSEANVPLDPPHMSSFILRLYRLRDQQFSEKRRNIILSKNENIKNDVQPIKYTYPKRSESTLLKETRAWQEKHKKIEKKNMNNNGIFVRDLPSRIVSASWKNYDVKESICQM